MRLKKIFQKLVAASSLILIAPCVLAEEQKNTDYYSESRLNIVVSKNQPTFTIQLKSNPTTGYAWFLREYDHDLLIPIKHEFKHADKGLVGAPGSEMWVFKVKLTAFTVPQQSVIRMMYARPWQGVDGSTQLVFRMFVVQ